jgi:hypothetical protein
MHRSATIAFATATTLAASVFVIALRTPIAQAATCYAGGCYNKMAAATGCSADMQTIDTEFYYDPIYGRSEELQLFYSPTCRAAWGRAVGIESNLYVNTYSTSGETRSCNGVYNSTNDTYYCSTPMVNDAGYESSAYASFTSSTGEEESLETISY